MFPKMLTRHAARSSRNMYELIIWSADIVDFIEFYIATVDRLFYYKYLT